MALPDLTTYTADDLTALWAAVRDEQKRRDALISGQAQMSALAAQVAEAVKDQPPRKLADIPAQEAIPPGGRVILADGKTWRNISGAYLPVTAGPATYPLGWVPNTPPPAAKPWDPVATYAKGDIVTRDGKTYECLLAHDAKYQGTWGPGPATPTVWRLLG